MRWSRPAGLWAGEAAGVLAAPGLCEAGGSAVCGGRRAAAGRAAAAVALTAGAGPVTEGRVFQAGGHLRVPKQQRFGEKCKGVSVHYQ